MQSVCVISCLDICNFLLRHSAFGDGYLGRINSAEELALLLVKSTTAQCVLDRI